MVNLTVNGAQVAFDGDPSMPLMWYLRDELGLTGTKFGCGVALCGACTVHINGEAVRSCGVPMSDVGRQEGRHDRGARSQGRAPGAGGVAQSRRAAMRLLPDRPDHAGRCAAQGKSPAPERRGDRPTRWPAICAAAAAISAFMRPCAPPPRERDMTIIITREIPVITNVSRRDMLKGIATAGGLVLAAQFPARAAGACLSDRRRANAERRSSPTRTIFVSIAKDGTVTIVAARAEMGTGAARTTLPMIIADELEAELGRVRIVQWRGRREEIRQPGHRRLAQRAPLPPADAAVRRHRAHRCWSRRRPSAGASR